MPILVLLALILVAVHAPAVEVDRRIGDDHLSIAISARDGGAVCSLTHEGQELVNDHDHGRQLQYAWICNDLGEPCNPTEAGSDLDLMKPTSTTRVLEVRSTAGSLTTVCQPAYWFTPGRHPHARNTTAVTNDLLTKTITLGWQGDAQVVVCEARIAIATVPTGPEVTGIRVEAPTIYAHALLTDHRIMDLRSGAMTVVPPRPGLRPDRMNTRIERLADHRRVPIMASADGRHALAFFMPKAEDFWGYLTWDVPSADPTNACTKLSVLVRHPAEAGRTYDYRTFLVVGTLAQVEASLRTLAR